MKEREEAKPVATIVVAIVTAEVYLDEGGPHHSDESLLNNNLASHNRQL